MRVLASALGGTEATVPSRIFSRACWTTLATDIAGDRRVLALARDLVDLVDVDDAGLGLLDIEIAAWISLSRMFLDILAHVAGLSERRGVGTAKAR